MFRMVILCVLYHDFNKWLKDLKIKENKSKRKIDFGALISYKKMPFGLPVVANVIEAKSLSFVVSTTELKERIWWAEF